MLIARLRTAVPPSLQRARDVERLVPGELALQAVAHPVLFQISVAADSRAVATAPSRPIDVRERVRAADPDREVAADS